jgi:trehalose 6-phosphate phosphatase
MSTHWASAWNTEFLPVINQRRMMIACAFDGVIAPVSESIADIELFERTKILLRKLSLSEDVTLVFTSSRELPDLKSRLGMRGVSYCGNNGMQIETPDLQWESAEARTHRRTLCAAMEEIRPALAGIPGIRMEDRQFSLSIGCKFVTPEDHSALESALAAAGDRFPQLRISQGRDHWEIRPNLPINSGAAIRFLMERSTLEPHNVIILGTEDTDTSAFEIFKESVTIQIDDSMNSHAHFRVNDTKDAAEFLFCLYVARKGHRKLSTPAPGRKPLAERETWDSTRFSI